MDVQRTPHLTRYLPLVALTTLVGGGVPDRDGVGAARCRGHPLGGRVDRGGLGVGARRRHTSAGVIWKSRSGSQRPAVQRADGLGLGRRWRAERQLASAVKLLDGVDRGQGAQPRAARAAAGHARHRARSAGSAHARAFAAGRAPRRDDRQADGPLAPRDREGPHGRGRSMTSASSTRRRRSSRSPRRLTERRVRRDQAAPGPRRRTGCDAR